ncbi:MAG: hypothetical protein GXP44_00965 [bacterium]|nr:hypothetical protein [bacterium]
MKKIDFSKIIGYFNLYSEDGVSIKALRDWKVLFFCSVFLFASLLAVDFCFFLAHNKVNETAPGALIGKSAASLNRRDLNDVLKELDAKERNFENILSAPEMRDPSL